MSINQGWQSHRRASAIFVTTVKLRCDTSLKLRMRFLLRLSKFFRCDFLCRHLRLFVRFLIISIFRAILDSHILQIVTLEQKLRKSFFGEIEFLAPSCSAGSALTPDTFFGEIQWNSVNESTVNKSSRLLHPICLERNRPNPFPL